MHQQQAESFALTRATLLAALTTLLTATGHVVGGGTISGLSPLAVLVPMLVTVLMSLSDRCRGILAVFATLGVGQVTLHFLLVLLSAHDHAAHLVPVSGSAMAAAHAVVTVVMAVLMCHADTAVTALIGALLRVLPCRLRPAVVDVPLPARPVPHPDVPLRASIVLLAAHARRGPPLAC